MASVYQEISGMMTTSEKSNILRTIMNQSASTSDEVAQNHQAIAIQIMEFFIFCVYAFKTLNHGRSIH
jgi:tRNA threonylcarbamoyladenosine modification (KEOPS) complex Cgi121 subunit